VWHNLPSTLSRGVILALVKPAANALIFQMISDGVSRAVILPLRLIRFGADARQSGALDDANLMHHIAAGTRKPRP
jgi:hypothetical protein